MDTYLTIDDAVKRSHITEDGLFRLAHVGKIRAVKTVTGEILLSENDLKNQPTREQFQDLAGIGIGLREAADRYHVIHQTISRWVKRGKIKVIRPGSRGQQMLVDEQDVAYEAAKYLMAPGQGRRTDKA